MTNRLIGETSPYLLQHAENPVDWFPWGVEAFQKAHSEEKPIFLSVGYSACHWCHVMERESFEDASTATFLNTHFVSIKVDREERPDIDAIYMDAVVAVTGQGGWPMSVFLTPQGKPFYGGTYFPPTRRYHLPSFMDVLRTIQTEWAHDRPRLLDAGDELTNRINAGVPLQSESGDLRPEALNDAMQALSNSYDRLHGGWGGAPKFPQASVIEFLLQRHHRHDDARALAMVRDTLDRMARGGIYDHVGGGFHRYSVDAEWLVPHFEKMLYDNALLARTYLHGWLVTRDPHFLTVTRETLDFLLRELRHPLGGFYAAVDADSDGMEGSYYLWSPGDVGLALPDQDAGEFARSIYGVTSEGNFEGKSILHLHETWAGMQEAYGMSPGEILASLEQLKLHLRTSRERRIAPNVDHKVLASWNGLLLTALAEAGRSLPSERYLAAARDLADFLLEHLIVEGRLMRSWKDGRIGSVGFLEDHASVALGLLAMYETDFNQKWFEAGLGRAGEILDHFTDPQGGFFDTRSDHEMLITRPKSIHDAPVPSGNSMAVELLLRLGALTGESRFADPAQEAAAAMQGRLARHPTVFAGWACALDFAIGPQQQLAVVGRAADPGFQDLVRVGHERYLPHLVRAGGVPGADTPALLVDRVEQAGKPTAYLCEGFTCQLPTTSPEQLEGLIRESLKRSEA
jgi:uncharacterized protein YyaL (SSP411 family)